MRLRTPDGPGLGTWPRQKPAEAGRKPTKARKPKTDPVNRASEHALIRQLSPYSLANLTDETYVFQSEEFSLSP
jgi:hypothetical protein